MLQKLNATMSAAESRYSGAVVTCLKLGSGWQWDILGVHPRSQALGPIGGKEIKMRKDEIEG